MMLLTRLRRHRALVTALAMCLCFAVRELRDRRPHSMHVLPLVVLPKVEPLTQGPAHKRGATDASAAALPPPQVLEQLSPVQAPSAASPPPQHTQSWVQRTQQNRSIRAAAAGTQQAMCSDGSIARTAPHIVLLMAGVHFARCALRHAIMHALAQRVHSACPCGGSYTGRMHRPRAHAHSMRMCTRTSAAFTTPFVRHAAT